MATKTEKAALEALRRYVDAAEELNRAWNAIWEGESAARTPPFDVLTENVPEGFVEFGEQLLDLIAWRDRVAAAMEPKPEDLGFEWQPDALNWVKNSPSDLGLIYIEHAKLHGGGAPEGKPALTDPVRVIYCATPEEVAEIEIGTLYFPTLSAFLAAHAAAEEIGP